MSKHIIEAIQKQMENKEKTATDLLDLIQETEFFFKVLKVKLGSDDPTLKKEAIEELQGLKKYLLEPNS